MKAVIEEGWYRVCTFDLAEGVDTILEVQGKNVKCEDSCTNDNAPTGPPNSLVKFRALAETEVTIMVRNKGTLGAYSLTLEKATPEIEVTLLEYLVAALLGVAGLGLSWFLGNRLRIEFRRQLLIASAITYPVAVVTYRWIVSSAMIMNPWIRVLLIIVVLPGCINLMTSYVFWKIVEQRHATKNRTASPNSPPGEQEGS